MICMTKLRHSPPKMQPCQIQKNPHHAWFCTIRLNDVIRKEILKTLVTTCSASLFLVIPARTHISLLDRTVPSSQYLMFVQMHCVSMFSQMLIASFFLASYLSLPNYSTREQRHIYLAWALHDKYMDVSKTGVFCSGDFSLRRNPAFNEKKQITGIFQLNQRTRSSKFCSLLLVI